MEGENFNPFQKESLDLQFCTQKGMFKTKKTAFLELFLQIINHLAWSDPRSQNHQRISFVYIFNSIFSPVHGVSHSIVSPLACNQRPASNARGFLPGRHNADVLKFMVSLKQLLR
jgi:hypothetical protein